MSAETKSKTMTIEIEVGNNKWKVEAHAIFHFDPHYGADADGNRGIAQWFMDEIVIEHWYKNDKEVKLFIPPNVENAMNRAIEKKDFNFWEIQEPESDDLDD